MFDLLLWISLALFVLGLAYRVAGWFLRSIGPRPPAAGPARRLSAAAAGAACTLAGPGLLRALEALLLDVLLQRRIYRESRWRWAAHMAIFYGFTGLLLMHALQQLVSARLFADYYPTVNPFFFLRDFFGVLVAAGVAVAAIRRYVIRPRRLFTAGRDHFAIALLATIIASGFLLEAVKITSHGEFVRMVEDYAGLDDEEEIAALRAYWVAEQGLVAAHETPTADEELLEAGREVHELNCADCHASARWAFAGYGTARLLAPAAAGLERAGAVKWLWYVHFLACFLGLAYLPFSKMFHLVATPIALVLERAMDPETSDPANRLTAQLIGLDACTHCGSCSRHCSAAMMYAAVENDYILPSEKVALIRRWAAGRQPAPAEQRALQEGVIWCTSCDRCTLRCPSGIRLRELWHTVREALLQPPQAPCPAVLSQFSFVRGLAVRPRQAAADYQRPLEAALARVGADGARAGDKSPLVLNPPDAPKPAGPAVEESFRHCFGCQSCTTVCPVVAAFEAPEAELGLLPHQIMGSLGLGLTDMARSSRMIWACLTCYQCQENCPQQVAVCDLLYDLKNRAVADAGGA